YPRKPFTVKDVKSPRSPQACLYIRSGAFLHSAYYSRVLSMECASHCFQSSFGILFRHYRYHLALVTHIKRIQPQDIGKTLHVRMDRYAVLVQLYHTSGTVSYLIYDCTKASTSHIPHGPHI